MAEQRIVPQGASEAFERSIELMDVLRSEGGCPWDGKQTHHSLVRYLVEESYEVIEAIEAQEQVNYELLKEELGDVLLQVLFHARIAGERGVEEGGFSIADVVEGLNQKLERRHPHVFGDSSVRSLNDKEVTAQWEELKKQEKPERLFVFDGIPPHLPALALADKVIAKADKGQVSLDVAGVVAPDDEHAAFAVELFEMVQRARAQGVDAEGALRRLMYAVIHSSGK
ncbi:MazG family protein [Rothia sp. CCM 9418]|uniref:MazG family protein n=1 Tax=Rothia sp. CCM 9418 TaxID=3402661 RepID=UPI003ADC0FF2